MDLPAGTIQDWQGVTPNLTSLLLANNDLEGTLPAHLPPLTTFYASNNSRLSGYATYAQCCQPWHVVCWVWDTAHILSRRPWLADWWSAAAQQDQAWQLPGKPDTRISAAVPGLHVPVCSSGKVADL